jgi:uncharacterized membrane protein
MSSPDIDDLKHTAAAEGRAVREDLQQTLLSGLALTVPLLVTVLILTWALNAVSNALTPLANALGQIGVIADDQQILLELFAAVLVFGLILVVGLAARHGPETHVSQRFDAVLEDVPGVGSIYTSVERMSDVMVEGDTESFQEVKIVEFPTEDSFALAFLTADSPATIERAADHEDMLTVFVPMAPNPVMGGHLINLPEERIFDVDLTVEEGMQAIMTTGMAIDERVDERGSG